LPQPTSAMDAAAPTTASLSRERNCKSVMSSPLKKQRGK
jgi:hypothetical protein